MQCEVTWTGIYMLSNNRYTHIMSKMFYKMANINDQYCVALHIKDVFYIIFNVLFYYMYNTLPENQRNNNKIVSYYKVNLYYNYNNIIRYYII